MPTWSTPENVDTGKFLESEGPFHLQIEEVNDRPVRGDKMIDGFEVTFKVIGAAREGDVGRTFRELFKSPQAGLKETQNEFREKRRTRLLVATSVMHESQLGQEIDFEFDHLVGRQICGFVAASEYEGKTYYGLRFSDFYHVDDKEAKTFPRNMEMLGHLPPSQRRVAGEPVQGDGHTRTHSTGDDEAF